MKIVNAKLDDLNALYAIYRETAVLHEKSLPDILKPASKSVEIDYLKSILAEENHKIFIAKDDNKIIGYVIFSVAKERSFIAKKKVVVYINDIGVSKKYREKGIGKKILDAVIKWCKKEKINRIELNVFDFNKQAINFYTRNKFNTVSHKMALDL